MNDVVRAEANGIWALVPVKCFGRGKSRLSSTLDPAAREALARSFCEHVLDALLTCGALGGVMVVTDCASVEEAARAAGAEAIRDGAAGSLSAIVDCALGVLAARGARGAIVLMSDLPRLDPSDVRALVDALGVSPVVLAPDRHEEGTNALGLVPPNRFATCFGTRDSFRRHQARAASEEAAVTICRTDGLAWDVDSPEDLALVSQVDDGARFNWKRKRPSRVSAA